MAPVLVWGIIKVNKIKLMKIAIIGIRGLPARYGGFETNVAKTAPFLAKNNIETHVYCRYNKKRPNRKKYQNVKLIYLKSPKIKKLATFWHTLKSLIHACLNNYDLIHVYNVGNGPLLIIPKFFGKRTIISVDGMDWKRKKYNFIEKKIILFCAKCASKLADKVIVDSKHVGKFYKNNFDVDTTYLPYGADIVKKSPPKEILKKLKLTEKKYFIFVGRFVPEKNIPLLIKAFKKTKLKNFKLALVGRATTVTLQNQINTLKNNKIVLPGLVYGKDVKALYKNAWAYVSASELEGTSPALLQAMGSKTCPLINNIPENRETIKSAGLTYKFNSVDSLSKQMITLAKNKNKRDQLAKAAQERIAKHFTWQKINQQYLKIVESFNTKK